MSKLRLTLDNIFTYHIERCGEVAIALSPGIDEEFWDADDVVVDGEMWLLWRKHQLID